MDTPIEKLISLYGNVYQAAKATGYSESLIRIWRKQGFIPFKRAKEIEEKTNAHITEQEVLLAASNARHH